MYVLLYYYRNCPNWWGGHQRSRSPIFYLNDFWQRNYPIMPWLDSTEFFIFPGHVSSLDNMQLETIPDRFILWFPETMKLQECQTTVYIGIALIFYIFKIGVLYNLIYVVNCKNIGGVTCTGTPLWTHFLAPLRYCHIYLCNSIKMMQLVKNAK